MIKVSGPTTSRVKLKKKKRK